jgi:cytoskeletal protein CcmA (bactofilin family)
VKGELSGDEDLLIHGQVDGSVALDLHSVTVGNVGRVKANITGRVITIEGVVEGNLRAQEQIVLRGSAKVQGDLKAPRIVLEDGATFRGLIDMGAPREAPADTKASAKPTPPTPDAPTTGGPAKPDVTASREVVRGAPPTTGKGRDPSPTGAGH